MTATPVLRKKKGRPASGTALPVTAVRLAPDLLALVDKWASKAEINRSDAIRRLVELGLTIEPRTKPPSADRAARAKELAAKAIDHLADPSANAEDKVGRKQRLLKGPEEFREVRVDRSRAKEK